MDLNEAITHCDDRGMKCNEVECAAQHRQLAVWLRQLRDIKNGSLDSLTDCEVYAVAEAIDEIVAGRKVKDYYFEPAKLGNEVVSWYGANIVSKEAWDDRGYHDDLERQELIPLPGTFSWYTEGLIIDAGNLCLTEQDIVSIMTEHGFERAPSVRY